MPKNRIKVSIMNTEYVIVSDEDEAYVLETAEAIEKKITSIVNANPRISMLMATTLVALDYCDIAKKSNAASDNLRSQIKDYLEESSKLRAQLENSEKEVVKLKSELKALDNKLSDNQKTQSSSQNTQVEANPSNRQVTSPAPISRPVKGKVNTAPVNTSSKVTGLGKADDEILDFFDQSHKR